MAAASVTGHWSYAVPLDQNGQDARPSTQRQETFSSHNSGRSSQRDRTNTTRRPSDYTGQSDSEPVRQRTAPVRASDSTASRKRSKNALRDGSQEKQKESLDSSAWIHRDKLARIEYQEMEDAGIHVRQPRRSGSIGQGASVRSSRSVSRARRASSKDPQPDQLPVEEYGIAYGGHEEFERKRVSTIPAADEEGQDFDPAVDTELRMPGEVAAERQPLYSSSPRSATSRIPVSKASSVPVPQGVVERDAPLPRSRHGSGTWNGSFDEMQYARKARSASIGSQVLFNDEGPASSSRPTSSHLRTAARENSPPKKARVPSKTTPTSSGRKVFGTLNGKSESSSVTPRAASTSQRPASRSGHKSRPSTSHQKSPEGEAPWIASMYKPDPRLPPDQQLLPTHAKRMRQEQWEKEGKTGTAYDRDLNLLNDEAWPAPKPQPTDAYTSEKQDSVKGLPSSPSPVKRSQQQQFDQTPQHIDTKNTWTSGQKANGDNSSETGSPRPGTSGGYRITPTISAPPLVQKSSTSEKIPVIPEHNQTTRVPDLDDKEEAKPKKGCCCIVM